jgi:Uma2 family endonuclease
VLPTSLSSVETLVPTHPVTLDEYLALELIDANGNPLGTELVDGLVVVSPAPRLSHETAKFMLAGMLLDALPPGLRVTSGNWIVASDAPATVRVPDIAVVTEVQARERHIVDPPLLAVEIVSWRSSEERDLVAKRREYAATGCPHYWVVMLHRLELVRFRLDPEAGAYVEAGRTTGRRRVRLTEPFPVTIDLGRLTA